MLPVLGEALPLLGFFISKTRFVFDEPGFWLTQGW